MIINSFWASIISAIMATGVGGGALLFKDVYDRQSHQETDIKLLAVAVKPLQDANIDHRLTVIEQNLNYTVDSARRQEEHANKIDDKLDKVLEGQRKR